jgi:hypothetical protein
MSLYRHQPTKTELATLAQSRAMRLVAVACWRGSCAENPGFLPVFSDSRAIGQEGHT